MATERREHTTSDPRNAPQPADPAQAGPDQSRPDRSRPAQPRRGKSPNEGEGSRSAARDYNRRTERFIHDGRVDKSAEEAKRAVDSPERDDLQEAEKIGRGPRRT